MRMYIGGDICPTKITVPYFDAGDLDALFGTIPELTGDAGLFIANLECALTESDTPIRKCGPNLRGKPAYARVLRELGITHAGISNNHVFDFGRPGLSDTMRSLEAAGISCTGAGSNERDARKPYFTEACGMTVAFIAVCEHEYSYALRDRAGTWGFDPFETMEDIASARARADYLIVLYHGGKEQSVYPSPRLRRACRGMVRAGAGLVLCQHSHCVGVAEEYRGAAILYGQGNLNFTGYVDHPHWQTGLLLQLDIGADRRAALTFHPVTATGTGVTLMEKSKSECFLEEFHARTATLLDDEKWLEQWRAFCVQSEAAYRHAADNVFGKDGRIPAQVFPHYLDCEAHLDVWRELYRTWHGENTDEQGTFEEQS